MSQIHIIDGQQDLILDFITAKHILSDLHKKSLEETLETYDFITFADQRFSEHLEKRNRIIIPDEDNTLREFVIFEAAKYKDTEGYKAQVFTHASYLELKKASIIYPDNGFTGTASQHAGRALNDTGWIVGTVESNRTITLAIENHTNPYEFLKRIAREFGLELRFRIEHDGNKITTRYVDLLERVGTWQGREVEFGKDLDGIRRIEKQDIVTALLGLGPEDEKGQRLEVLVEDDEALQRWGWVDDYGNLNHWIEPYEIQSERSEMTEEEARQYTRTALDKRIDTQVTYETTIIDLEAVPGMQNKKIRFGDTIKIKDTKFNPPLYLEARVFEQARSIKSPTKKDIKLGDYIEYTEEQVNAIWKQLQKQIQNRVSRYEMAEYTYDKLTIDDKDETVFEDGKTFAEATGIRAEENAKAFAVEEDKKIKVDVEDYADRVSEQYAESALEQAKQYAVAKEVYDNQMDKIASDMAEKADLEYIDGKLVDKVNKGDVYTKENVDNMINNTVSKTQYETDQEGIVEQLESHGTRIGQNAKAIGLKADDTKLDQVNKSLTEKIGNVEVKAEKVGISVSEVRADLDELEIGGRNYVPDSENLKGKWGNGHQGATVTYEKVDMSDEWGFEEAYRIRATGGTNTIKAVWGSNQRTNFSMRHGTDYTYSLFIKNMGDTSMIMNMNGLQGAGNPIIPVGFNGRFKATGRRRPNYDWFQANLRADGVDGEIDIIVGRKQVEEGNRATDWSPAPEDTDEAINQVSGRVETLDGEIKAVAGEVALKASQSEVDSLENRVSAAEGELQVLPGEISGKVSKDGAFGELNLSPDKALLDFERVNITGKLEAKHIKSLAGLNVNDQFVVDSRGNVSFGGDLEGARGTFGDVKVTDGDFNLVERETGLEYSATPRRNLIKDHSFELVKSDASSSDSSSIKYNWLEIEPNKPFQRSAWKSKGSPKVATMFAPDSIDALAIYGEQAIVVRNAHYVFQHVYEGIGAGDTYTVSGFFKRQWNAAPGGQPRIEIWHVDAAGDRKSKIVNSVFSTVKSDYSVARHATTFSVPSSFSAGDSLEVIISGGNSNWVQCDGVQMVEGDRPSVYQPEDSIWEVTGGNYTPVYPGNSLWFGAVYPTDSQIIRPQKNIHECTTGWIVEWTTYKPGTGADDTRFSYTVIPKQFNYGKSMSVKVPTTDARGTLQKYLYIYNDRIVGYANNGEGDKRYAIVRAVYEF